MTRRIIQTALAVALAGGMIGLAGGIGQSALAGSAAVVADGAAWSMIGQNGRSARLTLHPDGTGIMRAGPFSMPTSWWPQQSGGLCLENQRMGTRCITLVAKPDGYDGLSDGVVVMRLRR